ncbi:MAG: hypothetical protein PHQ54_03535 [Candidatus Omnitrophica bacterium]|nr:hypothetical protein [Candidatus Omnitrophota bacterium]
MKNLAVLITVFIIAAAVAVFAQEISASSKDWDYSLGSEYGKAHYTPLKKIESEVMYYPFVPSSESSQVESPMGGDFYAYILPVDIFGIEAIELEIESSEISQEKVVRIDVDRIAKELEEALPLIIEDARVRQREDSEEYKYGLRIKVQEPEVTTRSESESPETASIEQTAAEQHSPDESQVDILVNVIFGQGKIIIKLPPLKDPKEKERLIQELERIAHIMVRQNELVDIEHGF